MGDPDDSLEEPGDRGFLSDVLATLTTGVIATDQRFIVRWFNQSAAEVFPEVTVGFSLYELLRPFAHTEKIDRLLLRRERIIIAFGHDRPRVEWLRGRRRMPDGGHVILAWPAALTDQHVDRRVEFTMSAFHELRTPLTALIGFTDLLEADTGGLSPGQREAVAMIGETARYLARLNENIFDIARNSFGELQLNLGRVDLASVVESVIALRQSDTTPGCQQVELSLETGLPTIEADPERLRQVIGNLVDNALLHNPEGTAIRIRLDRAGDGLRLVIEDDGVGLDFDPPEKAFDTFYRPDSAVADGRPGSGIGLPLAKRLVDLHRGRLTLESSRGEGTRAVIWLPLERGNSMMLAETDTGI